MSGRQRLYWRWLWMFGLFGLLWSCSSDLEVCQVDADCQKNGRQGVCLKQLCVRENACERTCKEDTDCSTCGRDGDGFGFRCRNGTCLPVSQSNSIVDKHEQCGDAIGKACQKGLTCEKPSEKATFGYCYPQCDSSQIECDNGNGICSARLTGDVCIPKGTADKYAPCGLAANATRVDLNRLCKPSLSCVLLNASSTQGFCLPDCDPQIVSCDNDQGRCSPLTDSTGACIPNPQGKEGDSCVILDKATSLDPKQFCQPVFYCAQGKCAKRQLKGTYEKCDDTTTCGDKALCVALQQGATTGYCVPLCNTPGSPCESQTGTCMLLSNGSGACIPGTAAENAACDTSPAPEKLNPATYCRAGLRCDKNKCVKLPEYGVDEVCTPQRLCKSPLKCVTFTTSGNVGVCLPAVASCSATACEAGRICLSSSSGGVCARDCSSKGCPDPTQCSKVKVSSTQEAQICTP